MSRPTLCGAAVACNTVSLLTSAERWICLEVLF